MPGCGKPEQPKGPQQPEQPTGPKGPMTQTVTSNGPHAATTPAQPAQPTGGYPVGGQPPKGGDDCASHPDMPGCGEQTPSQPEQPQGPKGPTGATAVPPKPTQPSGEQPPYPVQGTTLSKVYSTGVSSTAAITASTTGTAPAGEVTVPVYPTQKGTPPSPAADDCANHPEMAGCSPKSPESGYPVAPPASPAGPSNGTTTGPGYPVVTAGASSVLFPSAAAGVVAVAFAAMFL